jgi:hypothetical protein
MYFTASLPGSLRQRQAVTFNFLYTVKEKGGKKPFRSSTQNNCSKAGQKWLTM